MRQVMHMLSGDLLRNRSICGAESGDMQFRFSCAHANVHGANHVPARLVVARTVGSCCSAPHAK